MVDVVQKQIQRAHALLEPALDGVPLLRGNDARHQVEGHDFFDALGRLVHGEGNSARLE